MAGSILLIQSTAIMATPIINNNNATSLLITKKQKHSKISGDLWARIRLGMKIPRPSLSAPLPNQTPNTETSVRYTQTRSALLTANHRINQQETAVLPIYRNTAYGRLKHNSIMRRNALQNNQVTFQKNNPPETLTRIHTRIDPHLRSHSNLPSKNLSSDLLALKPNDPTISIKHPLIYTFISDTEIAKPIQTHENIKYDRVHKHITWYTQHPEYLYQVTERSRPYLYHIVESLNQHNLPYELALLPIIESAYQPTALSPKSAAGLWQFIPSTGHDFDLQQTKHYDARLDITASTQAAMRYLTFLNQHFNGDWLLALAAYNCGLGVVDNAIKRNKDEGIATDYWSLQLPEETQEYVPRFLALSSIFANPTEHDLKFAKIKNEPYFIKVKILRKQDINYLANKDFKAIAQLANLSYEQFINLNPGYLKPELTAKENLTFLMPSENADHLHQRLESIAQFMNQPITIANQYTSQKNKAPYLISNNQDFKFITLFN